MATAGVTGVTQATARRIPTLVSWSGGKDCCMALYALQRADLHEVRALLSTVSEIDRRIGMHGVHRDLIERQAAALALPLDQVPIPTGASNATYEAAVATGLARHRAAGVEAIAFGDLFLADIRAYREETIERSGMTPLFPVWGRDTKAFVEEFVALGFRAVVASVDLRKLDASFAGRTVDRQFLADLPSDVDPCGENGEFHTFVFDGPNFVSAVDVVIGESYVRDGLCYATLSLL